KVRFELAQLNSVFSSQYLGTTGKRAPSRGRGTTHLIEKADREPAEIEKADREAEVEEADRDPEAKEADDDDDDVEEADGGAGELTINRRTEWQDNPTEDDKLTYSVPGGPVKLTMREVSSGFGMNGDENSGTFGLAPTLWGDATAKSKRVDWTVVNSSNFGV